MEKDLIITLKNDQSYYVISTTVYNEEKYAYLMNLSIEDDYIYVKEIKSDDNFNIEKITDESLIKKIALYLQKEII